MPDEPTRYELVTIADIIEKIPLDRLDAFLKDFSSHLFMVKATYDVCVVAAEIQGISVDDALDVSKMVWIDDDKPGIGSITMLDKATGEHVATLKMEGDKRDAETNTASDH